MNKSIEHKSSFQDKELQRGIYEKKAKAKEDISFEALRDTFGFRFCRTMKDLKFRDLVALFNPKPKEKVLDVGCFTGHTLNRLSVDFKIDGYGVDLSPAAIRQAKIYKKFGNHYTVASGYKLPFKANFFDGVVSLDVLEHVSDKKKFLQELFRVLKPNGWFLLYAVSRRSQLTFNWFRWLFHGCLGEYGEWDEAGHRPEKLADDRVVDKMIKGRVIYFHSFFTLIFDLYFSRLPNKIFHTYLRHFSSKRLPFFEKIFLLIYFGLFSLFLPLLTLADLPWSAFGRANGFFLIGRKGWNPL